MAAKQVVWTDKQLMLEAETIVAGRFGAYPIYKRLQSIRDDSTKLCQPVEAEPAPAMPAGVRDIIREALAERKHTINESLDWGATDDSHERTQIEWERLTARIDAALAWLATLVERGE